MVRDITALARRYKVDINIGTEGSPSWRQLRGIQEFNPPKLDDKIQTSTDYDDDGWSGNQRVGLAWKCEITVRRNLSPAGAYDPAQEYLRSRRKGCGSAGLVQWRYYERDGGPEAEMGSGIVSWEPTSSKEDDLATAKITLTGDGALVDITNPAAT